MKKIILSRMYVGKILSDDNMLGHEIINLFKADDGKNYIHINGKGEFKHKYVDNVLLVKTVTSKTVEVIAKASNLTPIWQKSKEEWEEIQSKITYDGVGLEKLFPNGHYFLFVHYEVKNMVFPKEKIYLTYDEKEKDSKFFIYLPATKQSSKLAANSQRNIFGDEKGKKGEAYCILSNLINDEEKWEKENKTEMISEEIEKYQEKSKNFNFLKLIKREYDELAYSNMFQYMLSNNKTLCEKFMFEILGIKTKGYCFIGREVADIDLFIEDDNYIVVIENKIKSKINGIRHDIHSDKYQNQLEKYHVYAEKQAKDRNKKTKYFIFSPNYNRLDLKGLEKAKEYKIIKYDKLFDFFHRNKSCIAKNGVSDKYYDDFLSALETHTQIKDNENYETMLELFIKRIEQNR